MLYIPRTRSAKRTLLYEANKGWCGTGGTESSAQSYGEEGEEGTLDATAGLDLGSARGSEEVPSVGRGRLPSRRGELLGKRERRKRRMDDADEDDLNSLDEPPEATKKRRRAGVYVQCLSVALWCSASVCPVPCSCL